MSDDAVKGPEFRRGWDAAIEAASRWHAARAKKVMVQARRARFPKTLEAEASLHERCAEEIRVLSPDDV
jgi:hypothetical protein